MKPKITIVIYDDIVEPLAQWIATGGTQGSCPEWFQFMLFARTLNCSAFEVEGMFRALNEEQPITGAQEWLNRAATAKAAEAMAQRIMTNRAAIAMGAAPKLRLT